MRLKLAFALVTALAFWAAPSISQTLRLPAARHHAPAPSPTPPPKLTPDSDADVRGAFLTTRPNTEAAGGTLANNPPAKKPAAKPVQRRSKTKAKRSSPAAAPKANPMDNGIVEPAAQKIAIGYTLFMANDQGAPVRVDPAREFRTGERVRILLEPNLDGYLYVFHSEGDGQPEMIFPDWRVDRGDNSIEAHVPYEVPSGNWFTFQGNLATERVYIVVTRDPLPGVPVGGALKSSCAVKKGLVNCVTWKPKPAVWARVQEALKADVEVAASADYGQAQTEQERLATTRGLGLAPSAPAPSVIRMSATTEAPVLVAVLDLVHK